MYAENRTKPTTPWKPSADAKEDKKAEEINARLVEKEEKESKPEPETNATSMEFNLLANLIC